MKYRFIPAILLIGLIGLLAAQSQHGSSQYRARNVHAGNLIRVTFHNHGMMGAISGDNSLTYGGEWPINSGFIQMGNTSGYVASEVTVFAGTNPAGDSLYTQLTPTIFCQGWDPNMFAHDSLGNFLGFEPLPGYYNLTNKEKDPFHAVAMSHQAYTWPARWPDKMEDVIEPGWSGHWNGYFGKDQKNADEESYFVLDDYTFKKKIRGFNLPRPIPTETQRGGLGLKQFVRGLQWSNPDAQDCIFWIYRVQNIGKLVLNKTVFGVNVGASIGARLTANTDYDDDCATFYRELDLTVNYDWDNIGTGGYTPVPWVGFAFLESPGNAVDGIDNDGDATSAAGGGRIITGNDFMKIYNVGDPIVLIDYSTINYTRTVSNMPAKGVQIKYRGNYYTMSPRTPLLEQPRNGMDDNLNGLIDENDGATAPDSMQYYLYIRDVKYNNRDYYAKNYFTGEGLTNLMIDERRDDGIDNNADWDMNTDDVGLDGKSGTGDPGEGDGLPTAGLGDLPGEPNVDRTDVDESDQIGLTSFVFYEYGSVTYSNDEQMWDVSRPGYFDGHLENVDADYVFSCGYFPLQPGQEESFSVGMVYGEDYTDIIRNKNIVQQIYNANYNFAVAPERPQLRAVAGDRKITLYWDSRAEQSVDRYLRQYDFEGYKIYRSNDPGFNDEGAITDGYGYSRYVKPIAIYDKIDSVYGFFPKTFGTGVQYNLGSETGLTHVYVDSPVVNGKRYFYAVNAYDKGDANKNIAPSETNMFVSVDASGEIRTGENVVTVIPQAPALGYQRPGLTQQPTMLGDGYTSGSVAVRYIQPEALHDGNQYEIQFLDNSMDGVDNDFDGRIDGNDVSELIPATTTGFVLKNLSSNPVACDTVWIYTHRKVAGQWQMVQNLYDDKDGDPYTLTANAQGMEFSIYNPAPGLVHMPDMGIYEGLKWSSNIDHQSAYPIEFKVYYEGGYNSGTAYPRQYKMVFYDQIVKKSDVVPRVRSSTGMISKIAARDVNFRIFDKQTGQELGFGFLDQTKTPKLVKPGFFSAADRVVLYERLVNDSLVITYHIFNEAVEDSSFFKNYGRMLGAGDTLTIYPGFPFISTSRFQFQVAGQKINQPYAQKNLDQVKVVPNPYVVTASWEPTNPYSNGRGPRSVQFIHLPQKCTIRIFAVDGTLVRTLEHDSPMTDGSEEWNLMTRDNMDAAYGVYLYHVQAPGVGNKTGRILVVK